MAVALNLTIPLKQDRESQERLRHVVASFAESFQKTVDDALASSQRVHFARLVVIPTALDEHGRWPEEGPARYLQVLTEFDGDPRAYTEFFRQELEPVFKAIFSLAEGAPPWEELNTPDRFYEYTHDLNLKSLGTSTVGDEGGYLFSASGHRTVRELVPPARLTGADHLGTASRS